MLHFPLGDMLVLEAFARKWPLARVLVERYAADRGYGGRMDAMLSQGQCVASDSWGNGAATRNAALALFPSATLDDAVAFCKVTHTFPESGHVLKGCVPRGAAGAAREPGSVGMLAVQRQLEIPGDDN